MEKIGKEYFIGILNEADINNDTLTLTSSECHELLRHLGFYGEKLKS